MEKVIEELDKAFDAPKRWRRKLIKWIFPEIMEVADVLREYYWEEDKANG